VPSGATVEVDGKEVGTSPVTLDDIEAGDHQVRASTDILGGEASVVVYDSKVARARLRLTPLEAVQVRVTTRPAGVQVRVDGEEVGETPLLLRRVASGERELVLTKDDHYDHFETLRLDWEAFRASDGEPVVVDRDLTERRFVDVALRTGPMFTLDHVAWGLELFGSFWRFLELGAALHGKRTYVLALRLWPRLDIFEFGILARWAWFLPEGETEHWQNAAAFGGGMGLGFETRFGRFGARGDLAYSLLVIRKGSYFPNAPGNREALVANLTAYWMY